MGRGVHKSPFDNGVFQNTLDFFGLNVGRFKPKVVDWTRQFTVPGSGKEEEQESLINNYQFV